MQSKKKFWQKTHVFLLLGVMFSTVQANTPLWAVNPLTPTSIQVPANGTAVVQYQVYNQSNRPHTLFMQPIHAIIQSTSGLNVCGNPFVLSGKGTCVLSLQVIGSQLTSPITDGPVICQLGAANQCHRPRPENLLHVFQAPPITDAIIAITGSPLTLTLNGAAGQLTITNLSTQVAAKNIAANFTGNPLDGNVTEIGNTCDKIAPGGSCTLTYRAENTLVPQANFTIQGANTNTLTAAIAIQSGSTLTAIAPIVGVARGATSVTLTGTGLMGATAVSFDGVPATSINVINSSTVTAVTPAHAEGNVDVVISTPSGGAILANGYTYEATAIGQPSGGGIIACLDGGMQNLIANRIDNSTDILWANTGTITHAQSDTDGALNTSTIVNVLGAGNYAANLCHNVEIDSQGNTPCHASNTCYDDWFLPANDQLNCLYANRIAIGGFMRDFYWSSTEYSTRSQSNAWFQDFSDGLAYFAEKNFLSRVRCVRVFAD